MIGDSSPDPAMLCDNERISSPVGGGQKAFCYASIAISNKPAIFICINYGSNHLNKSERKMTRPKFYQNAYLYLAIGLIIVFWGFANSYFGRLGQTALPYHVHGISATLWMILLVVQPLLYRRGQLTAHKYLGWTSIVIVPVIVLGGFEMMKLMIQNQENYPPNIVYRLAFIDAVTLLGFFIIYSLAIYYRKRLKLHARFMVCTIFGPLIPALTRVFFSVHLADNFNDSLTYSYLLIELTLLFIIWKERTFKDMRFTYLPVLVFTVVQHILMYFAGDWNWWVTLMNQVAKYSSG